MPASSVVVPVHDEAPNVEEPKARAHRESQGTPIYMIHETSDTPVPGSGPGGAQ